MTTPRICDRCTRPVPPSRIICPCVTARTPCERCGKLKNGGNPLCFRCRGEDEAKVTAARSVCPRCGRGKHAAKPVCWQCNAQSAARKDNADDRVKESIFLRPPDWEERLRRLEALAAAGQPLFEGVGR